MLKTWLCRIMVWIRWLVDLAIDLWFGLRYWNYKSQPLPHISNDILLMSATQLAAKIRQRELSSVQVVKTFISRIHEVNPILNAVVDNR